VITITNFGSGEIEISDDEGHSIKLDRESGNRLVMVGRMHTVAEFVEKLPALITEPALLKALLQAFQKASTSTDKWNLKEKFARLQTLVKDYVPKDSGQAAEVIKF